MKKLILLLAVAFSVSMFSCGDGEATAVDSDSIKAAQEATEQAAPAADEAAPADSATQTEAPADSVQ